MGTFDPCSAWAPALKNAAQVAPSNALVEHARVLRAGAAVLNNLTQLVQLHQARGDAQGLSRLVIALAAISNQAADAAERIESQKNAADTPPQEDAR